MFGAFFHGCDPRVMRDPRMRGCGRGGPWFRPGRGHFGHGGFFQRDFGPSGRCEAEAAADEDLFESEGEGMRGPGHGRGHGHRHGAGWEGGGWGFGPHREPGSGRPFEQGDLRWLTLDLIAAQPRHGYEIIKAIADALNGQYVPSPGAIYPTLTLLEETGLIASEARGTKKLYRLTDEGRAEVESQAANIRAAKARLDEAKARFGGAPAPELIRAMSNLRAAIQVRLSKGGLSAEALSAITAALDRATGEIERS